MLQDDTFIETEKTDSEEELDFYPNSKALQDIPEEFDWRGNPIGGVKEPGDNQFEASHKDSDINKNPAYCGGNGPNSAKGSRFASRLNSVMSKKIKGAMMGQSSNNLAKGGAGGGSGGGVDPNA